MKEGDNMVITTSELDRFYADFALLVYLYRTHQQEKK